MFLGVLQMKRLKDIPEEERIKTNFPVRLPKDLHSRLKAKCALNNVSMSDYIIYLIEKDLNSDSK